MAVAFGNDGYATDARSKQEVEAVRRLLEYYGGRELEFATTNDGYSWGLVCELTQDLDPKKLEVVQWIVWDDLSRQKAKGKPQNSTGTPVRSKSRPLCLSPSCDVDGIQPNIAGATLKRNFLP